MPCFMLRSMLLHAYMFRSMCLGFYAMSSWFCSSLCFALMLGLYAHMLDIMSMFMLCSDLCVRILFTMFYAQICICACLYAWIHVIPRLQASFHMFTHVAMLIHLVLCFHMLVPLDLHSICFMPPSVCLCAPCHVCMLRPRLCLSCHVLLQPFCRFIFLSRVLAYWFGLDLDLMVSVIVCTPWPILKGLDQPICMSMLAYFYALCLCWPLQFQALPRLTPLVGRGCVITFDTHEALFGCKHLGCISVLSVASHIPFPFSAPYDDMLAMLVCATCWLYVYLYTLAYMFMLGLVPLNRIV